MAAYTGVNVQHRTVDGKLVPNNKIGKGSYNTLHNSYAMLLQYIEENGYEICGSIRESYIDGVWNKETENEWLTEIQIPVK